MEFDVTTDVPCSRVTSTAIAVAGLDDIETIPFATTSKLCAGSSLGSLVVVPGNSSNVVVRIVTGLDGSSPDDCVANAYSGGCIVSRRALSFVSNQKLTVPVTMEQSCRDVPCGSGTTCVHGQCVPIATTCTSGSCTLPPPSIPPPHWTKMRDSIANGIAARYQFASAWTGTKLIVFSGYTVSPVADGGIYDPAADTWTYIPPPSPSFAPRTFPATVWTGTDFIVWGGYSNSGTLMSDGARLNLAMCLRGCNNAWTPIAAPPAAFLPGLAYSASAWSPTRHEMIVWGGRLGSSNPTALGAAYDPVSDSWRPLANSPLDAEAGAVGVWVGTQMLIFGGGGAHGAFYDPVADSWNSLFMLAVPPRTFSAAAWSGDPSDPVAAWGGKDTSDTYYTDGISFGVANLQQSNLPVTSLSARGDGAGWMSYHRLYTWGGRDKTMAFGDGAYTDFAIASQSWTPIPVASFADGSVLEPRWGHCAVWTGSSAIIWGGASWDPTTGNPTPYSDGAIFTP
jgi:hypothetical protein